MPVASSLETDGENDAASASQNTLVVERFPLTSNPKTVPHKLNYASLGEWFFTQFVQSAEAMVAADYMASHRAMNMARAPSIGFLIFDQTSPWQSHG
jgi:hypothetical protein